MAGDWSRLERDMRWILDPVNGAQGLAEMVQALRMNDVNYMRAVKNAFHKSVTGGVQKANFDACAQEDQGRVYALGRKILGLSAGLDEKLTDR